MCSVATNLVASIEFNPVRCATTVSHFGQLRNGSLATHSIQFSSTATSSDTNEYLTVPEHIGQNEETANRNEERTRNKLSFALKMNLNDAF